MSKPHRPRRSLLLGLIALGALLVSTSVRAEILGGDFAFNGVFRFDDAGNAISGAIPSGSAGLLGTAGIAVGPDGNIYVASKDSGEVLRYSGTTGAPLPSPLPGGRDGLFAVLRDGGSGHANSGPGPLRFGPDGHLYVSDYGGTTIRAFNGTTGLELPVVATGFGPPAGLAFAPDGDLYASNYGSGAVVRIHNGVKSTFIASGTGPILTPSSLLFLADGDLLVVSMFANEIHRYSSTGQYRGVFATIDPNPPTVDITNYPSDIAFDPDGNILVAVLGATNPPDNRGQLLRYDLSPNHEVVGGTLLETLVDLSPPIGSVAWIRSVAAINGDYDENGSLGAGDFQRWRADYGFFVAKGGGPDGTRDGVVDARDYVFWRKTAAANGGGAMVGGPSGIPEPSSLLLIVLGAFAFSISCRRNRRQIVL